MLKRLTFSLTFFIVSYTLSAQILLDNNRIVFQADNQHILLWNLSDSLFTPTLDDINIADKHLRTYFKKNATKINDYSKYFRQYGGLIIQGKRIIFVNAACKKEDHFIRILISYEGTGPCYFRANVNLKNGEVTDFKINEAKK